MSLLLDPNVAYLLLVTGFILSILALFTPGTGFLEIGALFAIILAGYAVYNLPINGWALALLLVGVVPFIFALRKWKHWIWLIPSLVSLIVGSIFIFRNPDGSPAIHPVLAIIVSVVAVAFLWIIGRKSLEAIVIAPAQDLTRLIGVTGEVRTEVGLDGTVYIGSEEWTARTYGPVIPAGTQVKVTGREGLVLIVEPMGKDEA